MALVVCVGVCWCVVVCGGASWRVVACGGVWWRAVACGGVWWCVVECCGVLWYVMEWYSVLRYVALHCTALHCVSSRRIASCIATYQGGLGTQRQGRRSEWRPRRPQAPPRETRQLRWARGCVGAWVRLHASTSANVCIFVPPWLGIARRSSAQLGPPLSCATASPCTSPASQFALAPRVPSSAVVSAIISYCSPPRPPYVPVSAYAPSPNH